MRTTLGRKESDKEIRKTKEAQQILLIQHLLNHGDGSIGLCHSGNFPMSWKLHQILRI